MPMTGTERARKWRKENPEKAREQHAEYRRRHRLKLNTRSRNYYATHKDKIKVQRATPEQIGIKRQNQKRWHEENCERVQQLKREWAARNLEKVAADSKARYQQRKALQALKVPQAAKKPVTSSEAARNAIQIPRPELAAPQSALQRRLMKNPF